MWAHRKGKSRLCFLWVLSAHHAWFEVLPVPSREWCSRGCGGDPGQIPRAVVSEDTQVLSMLQTGLCSASLSRRASESIEFQRHHQQAQVALQGWHIP